jgi:hypothetical protein
MARVFAHVLKVLPEEGFAIKQIDEIICRVIASTGLSMFSFGENIFISLKRVDDENTVMSIESKLKIFSLSGIPRNRKNIETIIFAVRKSIRFSDI